MAGIKIGDVVKVRRGGGIAYRVVAFDTYWYEGLDHDDGEWLEDPERVILVMVGDDRKWKYDVSDCTIIDREEYCGECGQIGCSHDGYDRSDYFLDIP